MSKRNQRRRVVADNRLPRSLRTAIGTVPVRMVEQPTSGDANAWGTFDVEGRVIEIKRAMGIATTRQIFLHECIHVALWDSGSQLTGDQEEQVCTALASFLLATKLVKF